MKSDISAEDRKSEEPCSTHLGPGRRKRQRRSYQPKMANRSRCSTTFSRSGQSSSNSLNSISADHLNRFKRKAKLKEVLFLYYYLLLFIYTMTFLNKLCSLIADSAVCQWRVYGAGGSTSDNSCYCIWIPTDEGKSLKVGILHKTTFLSK